MPPSTSSDSKKPLSKWFQLLLGFATAAGLFWLFGYAPLMERLHRRPFDSKIWKRTGTPYGTAEERLAMVHNLINSQPLTGKSRAEVIFLLGEPDGDPSFRDHFPNWHMQCYLGPSRVLFKGFDYDYLVLRLDDRGRVVATKIIRYHT